MCHLMRSLRINGFKTDVPYNAVYSRLTVCKGLIGYANTQVRNEMYKISSHTCIFDDAEILKIGQDFNLRGRVNK